jgi:hypothetical protein
MKAPKIGSIFEKFAKQYYHDYPVIFTDVLDAMLYIASAGKEFKTEYDKAVTTYGEQPLHDLINATTEHGAKFTNALGHVYEFIVKG